MQSMHHKWQTLTGAVQQEGDETLISVRGDAIRALSQGFDVNTLQGVVLGVVQHAAVVWAAHICDLHAAQDRQSSATPVS
jgi:hypothetical protein